MELLHKMDNYAFESFVGVIVQRSNPGYRLQLTSKSRDNGVDFILLEKTPTPKTYLIGQAKKYSPKATISRVEVQKLIGAKVEFASLYAVLATTGIVSAGARVLADAHGIYILDGERLLQMARANMDVVLEHLRR